MRSLGFQQAFSTNLTKGITGFTCFPVLELAVQHVAFGTCLVLSISWVASTGPWALLTLK